MNLWVHKIILMSHKTFVEESSSVSENDLHVNLVSKVSSQREWFFDTCRPFFQRAAVSLWSEILPEMVWVKEFIKRKWTSGLFWAVGAAEKKNLPTTIICLFLGCFFQLFLGKKIFKRGYGQTGSKADLPAVSSIFDLC